jgi:hypothetical protein
VALSKFNGTSPFTCDIPLPSYFFATDACLTEGGGHFGSDWFFTSWQIDAPDMVDKNINVLELRTVFEAAKRWGKDWSGMHLLVRSDNMATVAAINNSTSRSVEMLPIIKDILWLSVKYNFRLSASHLAGNLNVVGDSLSRVNDLSQACRAMSLLSGNCLTMYFCKGHMTNAAYLSLQEGWHAT